MALPGRPVLQILVAVAVVQEITLAGAGPVALVSAASCGLNKDGHRWQSFRFPTQGRGLT